MHYGVLSIHLMEINPRHYNVDLFIISFFNSQIRYEFMIINYCSMHANKTQECTWMYGQKHIYNPIWNQTYIFIWKQCSAINSLQSQTFPTLLFYSQKRTCHKILKFTPSWSNFRILHATFELYYRICSITSYRLPPHFLFNSCICICAVSV